MLKIMIVINIVKCAFNNKKKELFECCLLTLGIVIMSKSPTNFLKPIISSTPTYNKLLIKKLGSNDV